jgi:hypothetical protein
MTHDRNGLSHLTLGLAAAMLLSAMAVAPAFADPQARCSFTPRNGEVLQNNIYKPEYGHSIEIDNGSTGDAIIKVRDASTNALKVSFFVGRSQKASFDDLPDGMYVIQYAFGDVLASDCKSFITVFSADRFPGVESFTTTYVGNEVETDVLGYTLDATADGDVTPQSISASDFARD